MAWLVDSVVFGLFAVIVDLYSLCYCYRCYVTDLVVASV